MIGLPVFTYAKGNSSLYLKYLSAILVITSLLGLRCLVSWFKNLHVTSWEMLRQCVLQPNFTWYAWLHTSTLFFSSCYFRSAFGEEGFVLVLRGWQLEQQRGLFLTICVSVNPPSEYHLTADTEGTTALPSVGKLSASITENDFSPSVWAKLEQALWMGTNLFCNSSSHFARPAAAFAARLEEPISVKVGPKKVNQC